MIRLRARSALIRVLFCLFSAIASLGASELPRQLEDLLRNQIGFTGDELQKVHRGTVLAKILPETAKKELAVAGLIYAKVPWDFVLRDVEDIENFKKAPEVLQIHKFRAPPQERDFQGLSIPTADLAALSSCRPGNCDVKLSGEMMKKLANQRRQSDSHMNSLYQTALFQYFADYLNRGRDGLITYDDKRPSVSLASSTSSTARRLSWLSNYAPALWRSLEDQAPIESTTVDPAGFYYWSKENFAIKPVVSLTQTSVSHTADPMLPMSLILSRQLYASHYFECSIGLTILIRDPSAADQGVWIVYVNRSRVDAFGGWLGGPSEPW